MGVECSKWVPRLYRARKRLMTAPPTGAIQHEGSRLGWRRPKNRALAKSVGYAIYDSIRQKRATVTAPAHVPLLCLSCCHSISEKLHPRFLRENMQRTSTQTEKEINRVVSARVSKFTSPSTLFCMLGITESATFGASSPPCRLSLPHRRNLLELGPREKHWK